MLGRLALAVTFTGVRGDRSCHAGPSRDPFFPGGRFCLGGILGLFVENRRVIGLSGHFRSPRNPLGISVEDGVVENHGLGFEIRACSGRIPSCL